MENSADNVLFASKIKHALYKVDFWDIYTIPTITAALMPVVHNHNTNHDVLTRTLIHNFRDRDNNVRYSSGIFLFNIHNLCDRTDCGTMIKIGQVFGYNPLVISRNLCKSRRITWNNEAAMSRKFSKVSLDILKVLAISGLVLIAPLRLILVQI